MSRIGYVLKVYPRFSETFIVTEMLAREAQGEQLSIYALRSTTDARFHPEIAKVNAPVTWVPRPHKASEMWQEITDSLDEPSLIRRFAELFPKLSELPADEVAQGVWLARQVRQDGITHLHAHFASLAGRIAWIASRLSGVPYTLTTHAKDIYHESVDPAWLRTVCCGADRVVAISRFNEAHLHRVLRGTGARVSLQYNALDLDRFPYRQQATRLVQSGDRALKVAAVGRLVPKKGFSDLITAAHMALQAGTKLEVRIAGEGELYGELATQIEQLGLSGRIHLLGPKTQNEVRQLLEDSDVFVAPCIRATDGNIDGLPTVILEAMATGIPVIATAVSGLPEVVRDGDTGILLEPGDTVALAGTLRDFAHGRVDTERLASHARRLIEEQFDSRIQARVLAGWESPGFPEVPPTAAPPEPTLSAPVDVPAVRSAAPTAETPEHDLAELTTSISREEPH